MHRCSVVLVCFCTGMSSRMPVMNGLMEPKQQYSQSQITPGAGPDMARNIPSMQHMPFPDNLRSALLFLQTYAHSHLNYNIDKKKYEQTTCVLVFFCRAGENVAAQFD